MAHRSGSKARGPGAALLLVAVMALSTFAGLAPTAAAVSYGNFGSKVLAAGQDFNPTYAALAAPTICARDLGAIGFDATDLYYINMDGAGTVVAAFDVRVTTSTAESRTLGLVSPGDTDIGATFNGVGAGLAGGCAAFAGSVRYLETDGLPGFTLNDAVFWSADATAGVGDVRLAIATSATGQDSQSVTVGTVVALATDADIASINNNNGQYPDCAPGPPTGSCLAPATAAVLCPGGAGCAATAFTVQWFDANVNAAFDAGDHLLLSYGAAATPAPTSYSMTDVFLYGGGASNTMGTRVTKTNTEYLLEPEPLCAGAVARHCMTVAPLLGTITVLGAPSLCDRLVIHFREHDGIASRVLMDDVVLYSPGTITTCTPPFPTSSITAGTRVTGPTQFQGSTIAATEGLAGNIFYIDANSNGRFDSGATNPDPVYINRPVALGGGNACCAAGVVSAGDYRMTQVTVGSTTFTAGTIVAATDADVSSFAALAGNPDALTWAIRKINDDAADEIPLQTLTSILYHDADADNVWDPPTETVWRDVGATADGCGGTTAANCISSGDFILFGGTDFGLAASATVAVACPNAGCTHNGGAAPGDTHYKTAGTDFKVTGGDTTINAPFGETIYFSKDSIVNDEDFALSAATGSAITAGQVAFSCGGAIPAAPNGCRNEGVHTSDQLWFSYCPIAPCPPRMRLGDIQVSPTPGTRFTSSTGADFVPSLRAFPTAGGTLLRYNRGDPGNVGDDVFYASTDGATVTNQDERITPYGSTKAAGTFVASSDSEELQAAIAAGAGGGFAALIAARDIDGIAGYTLGDHVYWNNPGGALGGTVDAVLSNYDGRLSDAVLGGVTYTAGTFVLPGNTDITAGTAFIGLGAWTVGYHDENLNAVFDDGDVAYALPPGAPALGTFPQPVLGAIRLTGPGGATGSGSSGGTTTPPPPPPPPPPTTTPPPSPPTTQTPANFVTTITVSPETPALFQSFNITVAVQNTGQTTGTTTATLMADGQLVDTRTLTVAGGATQTFTAAWAFLSAGNHTLTVGSTSKTVAVGAPAPPPSPPPTAPPTGTPTSPPPPPPPSQTDREKELEQELQRIRDQLNQSRANGTGNGAPGFEPLLALAAVAVAVLARRRQG